MNARTVGAGASATAVLIRGSRLETDWHSHDVRKIALSRSNGSSRSAKSGNSRGPLPNAKGRAHSRNRAMSVIAPKGRQRRVATEGEPDAGDIRQVKPAGERTRFGNDIESHGQVAGALPPAEEAFCPVRLGSRVSMMINT